VAKSKYAPALFEKLQQQKEQRRRTGISLPKWWRNAGGARHSGSPTVETTEARQWPASPAAAAPGSSPDASAVAKVTESRAVADEAAAPSAPAAERTVMPSTVPSADQAQGVKRIVQRLREVLRFDGRRFEIELSPVGAVVLAAGVLLALIAAYQLGKRTGSSIPPVAEQVKPGLEAGFDVPVAGPGEAAARGTGNVGEMESAPPPVPVRSTPLTEQPAAPIAANKAEVSLPAAPPAVAAARVAGLNYIIVERFHTGLPQVKVVQDARRHAEQAQKWLAERGLQTAIYPMTNGKGYELWTVQGFKYPEQTAQCEELADKIRSYGKLYAKDGHYLFGCEIRKYQSSAEGRGRSRE